MKHLAALVVAAALAGCAAEPAPPLPTAAAPPAGPYRPPPPCRRHDDCLARGLDALEASPKEARVLLELACNKGSPLGCLELGKALLVEGPDRDAGAADRALREVCHSSSSLGDPRWAFQPSGIELERCRVDACAWRAVRSIESAAEGAEERLADATVGCALEGVREPTSVARENGRMRLRACRILAAARSEDGELATARVAMARACALGDGSACGEVLREPPPPAPAPGSAAVLSLPSLDTDGLGMRDVRCELADSSLLAVLTGMTVGAGFAQRKRALQRCVSGPTEVQLTWLAADLAVQHLTAQAADPKVAACVERVLRGSPSTMAGRCAATLLLGGAR